MHGRPWSEAEKAYARHLRTERRWSLKMICREMGRSTHSIKTFFERESIRKVPKVGAPVIHREIIPLTVFEGREKRANEPRTLTAILCGDPPFSQSALARSPHPASVGLVQSRESLRD